MFYSNEELNYAMETNVKVKKVLARRMKIGITVNRSTINIQNQKQKYIQFKKVNKPTYNANPIKCNL
jgi:hypothetical protein